MDYIKKEDFTKENILNMFQYGERDLDADPMSFDDFCRDIRVGALTDYDGGGCLVVDGKVVDNSTTICSTGQIYIENEAIISLETLKRLFADSILEIEWYNK